MATKRVVASGNFASIVSNDSASRLSMKCTRGGAAQRGHAGHGVAGQLRQRLPAEARAAGAENDDIARAVGEPPGCVANAGKIVLLFRQPQQRQAAVAMTRAQGFERALRRGQARP